MTVLFPLSRAATLGQAEAGGKAVSLAALLCDGFPVPDGLCVGCEAYRMFVRANGIAERIQLELTRKPMADMRWEELWDAALRIRNLFLRAPWPADLRARLRPAIAETFGHAPVAVRSSAPGEDSGNASFAGLHASFVHVVGTDTILEQVKRVWASLWNDGALLYRKELNLDTETAAMAVVIQHCVSGEASGVAFSRDPTGEDRAVIEAVHGLNQGLVDGAITPDRWFVSCDEPMRITHVPVERTHAVRTTANGTATVALHPGDAARPPLDARGVHAVVDTCRTLETRFGCPQDMEWTLAEGRLVLLQARPISTTKAADVDDQRPWYRSLSRTFANLKRLRERIERQILPEMLRDAATLASRDPVELTDAALADELVRRRQILDHWLAVYWEDLIPFAHGVRLFGQYYNDTIKPENPYDFVDLLARRDFASVNRNEALESLAADIRGCPALREALQSGTPLSDFPAFQQHMNTFLSQHGDLASPLAQRRVGDPSPALIALLLEMASRPARARRLTETEIDLKVARFLSQVPKARIQEAADMLELARVSYQLRDDDNLYVQGIETQVQAAVAEARRRLQAQGDDAVMALSEPHLAARLRGAPPAAAQPAEHPRTLSVLPAQRAGATPSASPAVARARQLVGQPSGPGVSTGPARVIAAYEDLRAFRNGDVLVCDAVSPTMTFVVPLASAIVERRGGMLIHGAIIAREYGIPCVTGVRDATEQIQSGCRLTVDGYLGIVRIEDDAAEDGHD